MGCSQSIPSVVVTPRAPSSYAVNVAASITNNTNNSGTMVETTRLRAARDSCTSPVVVKSKTNKSAIKSARSSIFGGGVGGGGGGGGIGSNGNGVEAFEAPPQSTRDDRRRGRLGMGGGARGGGNSNGTGAGTGLAAAALTDVNNEYIPGVAPRRTSVDSLSIEVPSRVMDMADKMTAARNRGGYQQDTGGGKRAPTYVNDAPQPQKSSSAQSGGGGGFVDRLSRPRGFVAAGAGAAGDGKASANGVGKYLTAAAVAAAGGGDVSSSDDVPSDDSAYDRNGNNKKESVNRARFLTRQQQAARLVRRYGTGESVDSGGRSSSDGDGGGEGWWATHTTQQQQHQQQQQQQQKPFHRSQARAAKVSSGAGAATTKVTAATTAAAAAALTVADAVSSSTSRRSFSFSAGGGDNDWPPRMSSPTMRTEPLTLGEEPAVVAPLSDKMISARARLPPLRIPGKDLSEAREKIAAMRGAAAAGGAAGGGGGGGARVMLDRRPLVR